MRALVVGGDSTIGSALAQVLALRGHDVYTTTRRSNAPRANVIHLDLAQPAAGWPALLQVDVAYLCAAVTKMDTCEDEPERTYRINVTHTLQLADRLRGSGARIVFLSTNQVFDGGAPARRVDEPVNPPHEYGRQKAEAERHLLAHGGAAVLRLTKVMPAPLPILGQWERDLRARKNIEAFGDLRFSPVPLAAVTEALCDLGERKAEGIFHLSNSSDISYADAARALAQRLGAGQERVVAVSARERGIRPQFLPLHATLDCGDLAYIRMPPALEVALG